MNIIAHPLPLTEYYPQPQKKDTIYLHHTAGGHVAPNVINWWKKDNAGRVATAYVIGGLSTKDNDRRYDGQVYQAFPETDWAHHLGLKTSNNTELNKKSIGIELCNYGFVKQGPGSAFITYVNSEVPSNQVYMFPTAWRGYRHYHRYTGAQLVALRELILGIANRHGIDIRRKWSPSDFCLQPDALAGKPGIWMHCNVRQDKWDMHPQPELIDMLNSL